MPGWFLYVFIALSIGSVILELESIYEFLLIFRVLFHFEKKWSVPMILKYHQIGLFRHYPQELFCLWFFFFQKKEVGCFSKRLSHIYQNIFCIEKATMTVYQYEINAV